MRDSTFHLLLRLRGGGAAESQDLEAKAVVHASSIGTRPPRGFVLRELQGRVADLDVQTKCVDATSLAGAPYVKVIFTGVASASALTRALEHGHIRAAGQEFPFEEKRVKKGDKGAGRNLGDASSKNGAEGLSGSEDEEQTSNT